SDPNSANGNIARWMLREVIDTNGNNIRFYYDVVNLTSNGGSEPARQIYPNHIAYTGRTGTGGADGPYQVVFVHTPGRPDPIVDGRFGFKTVMDQLLTEVDVNLTSASIPLIRSYTLGYITGQFNKTLLQTITQNGTDGTRFNQHQFSYFDEVGNGTTNPALPLNVFGTDKTVNGANGITAGTDLVAGINGTAFSSESNTSTQTHLYKGTGTQKEQSSGNKTGSATDKSQVTTLLIDLNGDGLVDQVFVNGTAVSWVPNTGTPGAPSFAATSPQPVAGISAISQSTGSTSTQGSESYVAPKSISDVSDGQTNEQIYFVDVNGDGLPDLVNNGQVLFNQGSDANGNPFFGPNSPTPLGPNSAVTNTAGLITTTADQQSRAQLAFPLVDSLRRWVAPFTGTINVTGQVALTQTGDASADGVRAAVQLENTELFSVTIAANDTTTKQITGLTGISVTAGQRLYFRVDSINDGAF